MFFFYTIIFTVGLVTTYTDIRFRKIKNIHLVFAIMFGLIAYIHLIASHQIPFNMKLVWNVLIGMGIGLLLYFTDTWGAGDAKLFTVYCLLMPTEKYSKLFFYPSIAIFTNIFLVSTPGILIISFKDLVKDRNRILAKIFSKDLVVKLAGAFFIIFSLKWIIEIIVNLFIPQAMFYLSILIMFFLYVLIIHMIYKFKKNRIIAAVLVSGFIMRFFVFTLDFNIAIFFYYLKMTSFYTLLFYVLSAIFDLNKTDDKEKKTIPFAPLMFLGAISINTNLMNWVMGILSAIRK